MPRQRLGKIIIVVAVVLVVYVVATRITDWLNRDACLDSGRVWDSRNARCHGSDEGT
jgi:hypothetical protein